jgi:hypothetical protein
LNGEAPLRILQRAEEPRVRSAKCKHHHDVIADFVRHDIVDQHE